MSRSVLAVKIMIPITKIGDSSMLYLGKKAARAAVKSRASAWWRFLGAKSRSASHWEAIQ